MASTHPSSPARPRGGRPPRRFGSSAAPDAVLDLPGSAKVSCLLMEDAVAAGQVSVGSGDGKVALFANPFLDGKEEALVVTGSGALTYLRRTGSETGWEQSPVVFADGEPVSAVEVVVVQHPQDLTLWAVFVAGADGQPHALQLAGPAADEGPCTWEYRREALSLAANLPVLNTLSHLSVFYDGRAPHITAIDPVTGNIATIFTVTNAPQRFSCQVWWISASKTGPVEEVAGGRANGLQVCYARVGSTILRFDLPPGEPVQQPVTVATDAYRLVGTFPPVAPAGVGFVYLDKAQVRNLVAVNWRSWSSGPIRTRTPGLGLHTAKCWVEVNQMLHVYGLDPDNTLKVLHQASWDSNNLPVWSAATIRPVPPVPPHTAHTADGLSKSTVPSCVGLVPKVAMFALDPFPDHRPSQLVKLEGVTPSGDAQFALHTQDVTSTQWSRDKVRLPVTGTPQMVTHYVSSVTVLDRRGNPMPGLPVDISAESVVEIQCEGASYLVGPGHSARLATNPLGRITIATSADSLLPAVLHVDAPGLERGAIIQPAAAVHAYLGGSGTLPSQQGYFTADALRDAKAGGAPIVDPKHHASLAGVVASTKNLFELADGGQATSKLFRGVGAAPPIHGFAVGSAPSHPRATADVTVGYTEFHSPVEVHNHLKGIRELPEYGGVWDDFTAWAGDVWEGIKNGVVKVYEVVVEAVAAVFIWIGDKIVELVGFVVDSIVTAVRAVEAVIREVVDTIVKVVDWLKALFGFEDIWDTKRALEAGLHMMMNHLAATISHYGDDLHGWFLKQETKAHDLFEKLKDEFRDRPMGDAANRIPAVTDTSGQVIATGDLQSNPQATWLLDRAFTPGAVPDGSLENLKLNLDPKLTAAWDAFVAKVSDAKIIDDFGAILGDLGTVLAQLVDPADPELAVKTSLIALIDVLDRLIHIGLVLADAALQAVVTLIVTLVNCMDALLATALPLGPISRLFTWIQTRAGIEQPDDLTLGGLICLIPAFAVTVVHKLVNGVESAPFRGGYFPVIPMPKAGAPHAVHADAADAQMDVAAAKRIKAACGIIMTVCSITNGIADVAPLYKESFTPFTSSLVAGMNAFGTTWAAVAALPPLNGKADGDKLASALFAATGIEAGLQWATLVGFLSGTCKRPAFKNVDEHIVWGPIVTTAIAACQIGFAIAGGLPNDYTMAMRVLAAFPGLDQFVRIGILADRDTGPIRAFTVGAINVLAGATAGLMLTVPAFLPGPDIPQGQPPHGKRGDRYHFRIQRTGEHAYNAPLTWTLSGSLPEGLSLHPSTGVICGIPQKAESTTCTFTCTDSYGPAQSASRYGFTFIIDE